jgi:hypothetical protein
VDRAGSAHHRVSRRGGSLSLGKLRMVSLVEPFVKEVTERERTDPFNNEGPSLPKGDDKEISEGREDLLRTIGGVNLHIIQREICCEN